MSQATDLAQYLKENGWDGTSAEYTKTNKEYSEKIELGDMGDYMWSKQYLNTKLVKHRFFSYPESLVKFLKEKNINKKNKN